MRDNESNPYLEQEVLTASPAKLRFLLLQKATSQCQLVVDLWSEQRLDLAAQWQIRLRDMLTELLGGVTGKDELSQRVSDLYIFMIGLLTKAEADQSVEPLKELLSLLEIETETWSLVQKQFSPSTAKAVPSAIPVPYLTYTNNSTGSDDSTLCFDA